MSIGLDTVVKRSDGMIASDMEGMTVMLDVENGFYYAMDDIATRIWELTVQPVSVRQLIVRLANEYEAEEAEIGQDVLPFLEDAAQKKIVVLIS